MKKFVSISVNDNPKYLYFLPLTSWCWRKLGWEPILMHVIQGFDNPLSAIEMLALDHSDVTRWGIFKNKYKTETLAQVSRLYISSNHGFEEDYFMTSDIDLLPLSDYWQPDFNAVTSWGRDLTDYHYPMAYVGMRQSNWNEVMVTPWSSEVDLNVYINRDLDYYVPKQKNVWTTDQQILTERLLEYGKEKITHIDRGIDPKTHYPIGRVDRSSWSLNHRQFIDAHLPHDILTNDKSFHNVMQLLHTVWPKEDWKWFIQYTKEFKKLL